MVNQPLDECVTIRGLSFAGIRLISDAIVNLSPKMIIDVMCPVFKRFENEFGSVMLHYCTVPAPSHHVVPALIKGGGVVAVDNRQGYKTLLNEEDYLQNRIAVCTDADKNDILNGDILKDEFFSYKERPLSVSVFVDSVDEGKKVPDVWNSNKIQR